MKRSLMILVAGLILALDAWADGKIVESCCREDEIYSYADDESWYSEPIYDGSNEIRVEWQWHTFSHARVLRFRRVVFHRLGYICSIGPWEVKVALCLPACRIGHVHCYAWQCQKLSVCRAKRCVSYQYYKFEGVPLRAVRPCRYVQAPVVCQVSRPYCSKTTIVRTMEQHCVKPAVPPVCRTVIHKPPASSGSAVRVHHIVKPRTTNAAAKQSVCGRGHETALSASGGGIAKITARPPTP